MKQRVDVEPEPLTIESPLPCINKVHCLYLGDCRNDNKYQLIPMYFYKDKDLTLIWIQVTNLSDMRCSDRQPLPPMLLIIEIQDTSASSRLESFWLCMLLGNNHRDSQFTHLPYGNVFLCEKSLRLPEGRWLRSCVQQKQPKLPSERCFKSVLQSNPQTE